MLALRSLRNTQFTRYRNSFLSRIRAMSTHLPKSKIPIFTTVAEMRKWRSLAFAENKSVGFVATMGALHEGHISLVRRSLKENDLTVLSIFVNPAQFAPHEDLATYPRTLPSDLELLSAQSEIVQAPRHPHALDISHDATFPASQSHTRTPSAVFLPSVPEMYPSGISQDRSAQKGTFVEVTGYGEEMEGKSRPGFFRGVATVVTKLFNIVQPTHTYFGQKDIQQALLLRRMCRDLLLSHPTPENLHIVPTTRNGTDSLALSSRNAYLSAAERPFATVVYQALDAAKAAWDAGEQKSECVRKAAALVETITRDAAQKGVVVKMDYVEMNGAQEFEILGDTELNSERKQVLLSGAVWVGKTRLIDNLVLGDVDNILC